ncbi:MAG: ribonuclease HII [Candidatus Aenigmarchaeota archaeon]|nr:ribonuclease HII [Candidatus Aenigmarchaeota archaeon]MDW8149791.1 ribonuclease HII [Candidatus Aenigmarchaeota archaeon]
MKTIAGIDEAGRGAIIGPLVIACVAISEDKEKSLKEIGVKDSKKLSKEKREELYKEIERLASNIIVIRINACKIDSYRKNNINLDEIEAMKIAQIIDSCEANVVFVDSLEKNSKKFEEMIRKSLKNKNTELIVENYLDESIPVVSAASIIAKVERDKAIEDIKKFIGVDFGSGYPGDPLTVKYLEELLSSKKELPIFVRESWITLDLLKEKIFQKSLKDFIARVPESG